MAVCEAAVAAVAVAGVAGVAVADMAQDERERRAAESRAGAVCDGGSKRAPPTPRRRPFGVPPASVWRFSMQIGVNLIQPPLFRGVNGALLNKYGVPPASLRRPSVWRFSIQIGVNLIQPPHTTPPLQLQPRSTVSPARP